MGAGRRRPAARRLPAADTGTRPRTSPAGARSPAMAGEEVAGTGATGAPRRGLNVPRWVMPPGRYLGGSPGYLGGDGSPGREDTVAERMRARLRPWRAELV